MTGKDEAKDWALIVLTVGLGLFIAATFLGKIY